MEWMKVSLIKSLSFTSTCLLNSSANYTVNHASLARNVKVMASAQCLAWTSNPAYQALHFFWSSRLYEKSQYTLNTAV